MKKVQDELCWKSDDGRLIFGGEPASPTGIERGLSQRLSMLKKIESGIRVLSVGCGTATDLSYLNEFKAYSVGLDAERGFLVEGKKRDHRIDGLVQAIGESIPLCEKSFNLVLLLEVLEHVKNPERTLTEIHRVLNKNGALLLTVPNRFFLFETHGIQICNRSVKNLMGIGIPFFSFLPDSIRKRFERARIYHQSQIVDLLKRKSFETINIEYLSPPLDIFKKTPLTDAVRKVLISLSHRPGIKILGPNIMVLSIKKTD